MVRRLLGVESLRPSRLMDVILRLVRSELMLALTRNVHKWKTASSTSCQHINPKMRIRV